MTNNDFSEVRFAPAGRCIYCGSDADPDGLGDEHIIPFALGGKMVLPQASCKKCGSITGAFEGKFIYHYMDAVRWQTHMPSRRPRNRRPTSIEAIVGSAGLRRELALKDHPSLGYLLDLPNPGIFRGAEPTDIFQDVTVHSFSAVPDLVQRIARLPDGAITFSGALPVAAFVRTLAKIGHALATAEHGMGYFSPFLEEFIRTGRGPAAYFIGGTYGPGIPAPDQMLHRLGTEVVTFDGRQLVVARIRLFAYVVGIPVYTVVVGELDVTPSAALSNRFSRSRDLTHVR
jgi:hypothetical protein